MKKMLLLVACLLLFCQPSSAILSPLPLLPFTVTAESPVLPVQKHKHLKFAGIPIDGTLSEFGEQMKKKKYRLAYEDEEIQIFRGSHAGKKDCLIYVYAHPDNGKVFMVGVNFGAEDQWDKLKYRYLKLKTRMTSMFGEPVLCTEVFHTAESPRNNAEKMDCIRKDLVEYVAGYRISNGFISVKLVHSAKVDPDKACIMLYYTDRVNCVDQVPGQK